MVVAVDLRGTAEMLDLASAWAVAVAAAFMVMAAIQKPGAAAAVAGLEMGLMLR